MVAHVLPACIDHRLVVLAGLNELVAVLDLAQAPLFPHNQAHKTAHTAAPVTMLAYATLMSLSILGTVALYQRRTAATRVPS